MSRSVVIAVLALLGAGTVPGCSDDESSGTGVRGESCRSTLDCDGSLACVSGVCSVREFGLKPTRKECVFIECRTADDCCDVPDDCEDWKEQCDEGSTLACTQHEALCLCDSFVCEEDRCHRTCDTNSECLGVVAGGACVDGRCAQCGSDDDCSQGDSCIENQCVTGCEDDADCPYFHECQDDECVDIGCANDRECIAATGKSRAVCRDKDCVIPCSTDIECDDPNEFGFAACIEDQCVSVGCETDEECRIQLDVEALEGDAECRDVAQ